MHSLVKLFNPHLGENIPYLEFAISDLISNPEMNKRIITSLVFHVCSSNQVRGFYHALKKDMDAVRSSYRSQQSVLS